MNRKLRSTWYVHSAILIFITFLINANAFAGSCTTRIMPLGDSITEGYASTDGSGYRLPLATLLLDNGFTVDFVGSLKAGPDTFDNDHEGHGGWYADDPVTDSIAANVYNWLTQNPTDYILLHIGTNDITAGAEDPAEVAKILDEIDRFDPDITVFLARIIDRATLIPETTIFNDGVEAMALDRISTLGDKIVMVDQQGTLDYTTDLADTLHPNDVGYQKMANTWYSSLSPLLADRCSGPPQITSTAASTASVNEAYQYNVRAIGEEPLYFELTYAPVDMNIDIDTGIITWLPTLSGIVDIQIRVYNVLGETFQNFGLDVRNTVTMDNGDAGTTPVGSWLVSSALDPYGVDSLYSKTTGDTYTFDLGLTGPQEISLWWTEYANRLTNAPVDIYDGTTLLDTVTVNQQINGGQWNLIGTYSFSVGARVVIRSLGVDTVSADAVRLAAVNSTIPVITTTPVTQAELAVAYSYDVDAIGTDPMTYALLTAPVGMTIDPATGLIDWTPDTTGDYSVTVEVSNVDGSTQQSFTITVTDPSLEVIMDNGDAGTTPVGSWLVSGASFPYGVDSLYSNTAGDTYTFDLGLTGTQEVSLWWTDYANRLTDTPVDIYDGTTLLDTVAVNQQINGGQWNLIGTYNFSLGARVVIRSLGGDTVSADAVRFVPANITIPLITTTPATQAELAVAYSYDVDAIGTDPMTYALLTAPVGMTIDPATGLIDWTPDTTGDYSVTVEVSNVDGSTQQSFTITVTDPSLEVIMDNGDAGTTPVGSWLVSGASFPYGVDSLYSNTAGDTYTFEVSLAGDVGLTGTQEISLWWTEYANRLTNAPVDIYDGTTLLDTVAVNQQINGGQWNLIGIYNFSLGARVVIRSLGGDTVSADAVRFVPVNITIPLITTTPATQAELAVAYSYDVDALGTDPMTYALLTAPVGMTIDPATGLIDWTPDTTGDYSVTVEVSNVDGSTQQSFTITVTDPSLEVIMDNGDAGTTPAGSWLVSGASFPYGVDSLYSKTAGDTYTFDLGLTGIQEVSLWWTDYVNRLTDTPVDIYDGTTLLDTVAVNQQINGGQWNLIGTYSFSVGARVVIRSLGGASASADAVRLLAQ